MNQLYCSTGTMVGRINGNNYELIAPNMKLLLDENLIDGAEFIMIRSYYDKIPQVIKSVLQTSVPFPIMHIDKNVGEMLSECDNSLAKESIIKFEQNCKVAKEIGSFTLVFHLWGGTKSDSNIVFNISKLPYFIEIANKYDLKLLIENIPCVRYSGLSNWRKLYSYLPDIEFIFDSRFGAFHDEINDIFDEPIWNHIKHIHISDYSSFPRDFSKIHPILHPGEGVIDFNSFFKKLKEKRYSHSITLESPVMVPDGIEIEKLKESLSYLRKQIRDVQAQ